MGPAMVFHGIGCCHARFNVPLLWRRQRSVFLACGESEEQYYIGSYFLNGNLAKAIRSCFPPTP